MSQNSFQDYGSPLFQPTPHAVPHLPSGLAAAAALHHRLLLLIPLLTVPDLAQPALGFILLSWLHSGMILGVLNSEILLT